MSYVLLCPYLIRSYRREEKEISRLSSLRCTTPLYIFFCFSRRRPRIPRVYLALLLPFSRSLALTPFLAYT